MRLKLGIFASSGAAAFFEGIVNWLIGANNGELWASQNGTKFQQIETTPFGSSNVNDVFYGTDVEVTSDTANTGILWDSVNSSFGNQTVTDIANNNNNLWVAVGYSGQLRTSTDARTWVTQNSNFGNTSIISVAYGNNLWVAGGWDGQLRTSTDAITWVTRNSNFGITNINSVAYGNNLWVAAGWTGQLRTSTNAITWTTRTSNFGNSHINSVAYSNNLWVAVGQNGQLRTSTDTITWVTRITQITFTIQAVGYGNGLWAIGSTIGGRVNTSTDTINWATRVSGIPGAIFRIVYGNGLWVISNQHDGPSISDRIFSTSTDGITWTTRIWTTNTANFGFSSRRALSYGNGIWSAGGSGGEIRTSPRVITTRSKEAFFAAGNAGKLFKSSDGLSWSTINTGDTTDINVINYGGSGPVNVGVVWTTLLVPMGTSQTQEIAYGQGRWVFGTGSSMLAPFSDIASSTDLMSWTTVQFPEGPMVYPSVAYGNNAWLIGGINTLYNYYRFYRSTNGINWTTTSYPNQENEFISYMLPGTPWVAYGNGLWLIGGFRVFGVNYLRSSTDLVTWTTRSTPTPGNNENYVFQYLNNSWYLIDNRSIVHSSTNAISWTTRWSQSTSSSPYSRPAFGQGIIIQPLSSSNPNQLISTNGIDWATRTVQNNPIGYLAYGNGLWYSAGNGVKSSTDSISWTTVWQIDSGRGIAYGSNRWVVTGNTIQNAYSDALVNDFRSYFIGVE